MTESCWRYELVNPVTGSNSTILLTRRRTINVGEAVSNVNPGGAYQCHRALQPSEMVFIHSNLTFQPTKTHLMLPVSKLHRSAQPTLSRHLDSSNNSKPSSTKVMKLDTQNCTELKFLEPLDNKQFMESRATYQQRNPKSATTLVYHISTKTRQHFGHNFRPKSASPED
jgi:hypothetical protein